MRKITKKFLLVGEERRGEERRDDSKITNLLNSSQLTLVVAIA
jgi:hypothetical protein